MNDPAVALSDADRRMLRIAQADAALSLKSLAEKAGMSASSVWRRIRELETLGVIRERVTVLDPMRVGLSVCILVNVDIRTQDADARRAFERWAVDTPMVTQCFAVTGAHDYTLIVRAASVPDYERFLTDELLAHPSVAHSATHLVLRQIKRTHALPI